MRRILTTGILMLSILGWINGNTVNSYLKLWYTQPAVKWLEALPIGNGSLGGMISRCVTKKKNIQMKTTSGKSYQLDNNLL